MFSPVAGVVIPLIVGSLMVMYPKIRAFGWLVIAASTGLLLQSFLALTSGTGVASSDEVGARCLTDQGGRMIPFFD